MPNTAEQKKTPWAVTCDTHGQQFLSREEFNKQTKSDSPIWICPVCQQEAVWNHKNYSEYTDEEKKSF